jgi:hypothetical protein
MNTLRMMNPASTICTKSRGRQILAAGLILVAAAWGRGGAAEENLRDFLYLLVKRQRPDGSWGTFPTQRRNKARHAVFTATTALWVYLYTPGE